MTEDFVQLLEQEAFSPEAIYHDFQLAYWSEEKMIFVFFEGVDDKKFYLNAIWKRKPRDLVYPYICDGKRGVLSVRRLIEGEYSFDRSRMLFFVDKDHDDYLGKTVRSANNLFVTDTYSIENYLVCESAVEALWLQFNPNGIPGRQLNSILDLYREQHKRFIWYMRPLMACGICHRRSGVALNFSSLSLKRCFKFDGSIVKSAGALQEVKKKLGVSEHHVELGEILRCCRKLKTAESSKWLRGKFELWFFEEFLCWVWQRLRTTPRKPGKSSRRVRAPHGLTGHDLFETLAHRIDEPPVLSAFLDRALT